MLREMQEPLIPYRLYEEFGALGEIEADQPRLLKIRELVNQMPMLNQNTLKFTMAFFKELVSHEKVNKMTAYNCAVTVGPNIFRSADNIGADILGAGIYYDTMIKMIEYFDVIFEGKEYIAPVGDKGGVGIIGKQTEKLLNVVSKDSQESSEKGNSSESEDFFEQMRKADEDEANTGVQQAD